MIRYAKLPLTFNLTAMQTELQQIKADWQAHFNTYYYEGNWTALALRSPEGNSKNIIPDLMTGAVYRDTELMVYFPSVIELLSRLNCPIMAVRFLNLQAGAIIKPHRDNELAFEKGEARLHFTAITNAGVKFYIEDVYIPFAEGDCWYMNANLPHSVVNKGNTDRIHLVIDCKVNDWLRNIMAQAEITSVIQENDNDDLRKIINELKRQNTDAANNLVAKLEQQLR